MKSFVSQSNMLVKVLLPISKMQIFYFIDSSAFYRFRKFIVSRYSGINLSTYSPSYLLLGFPSQDFLNIRHASPRPGENSQGRNSPVGRNSPAGRNSPVVMVSAAAFQYSDRPS